MYEHSAVWLIAEAVTGLLCFALGLLLGVRWPRSEKPGDPLVITVKIDATQATAEIEKIQKMFVEMGRKLSAMEDK